jgi:hypothetical protein
LLAATALAAPGGSRSIPVIYCTDLFHPHEDPDDHFDLAAVYAISEFDLKGVVLDQGGRQLQCPGRIPVSQMNWLTERNVPAVLGLEQKLRLPGDKAVHQKPEFQAGVELILQTLRSSPQPVMIITVGSVRDVVAAFNREPDLFRARLGKLLVFIGEASDPKFREYNVELDRYAYVGLMRSGLPIHWVPCFDGGLWQNQGRASLWQARHAALLGRMPDPVIQYFIYALEKETGEPLAFLKRPVDPARKDKLLAGTRNLWCTVIFAWLAGQQVVPRGATYVSMKPALGESPADTARLALFRFAEVSLAISDDAVVNYGTGPSAKKVMRFEVADRAKYAQGMTAATADLFFRLPVRPKGVKL